MDERDGTAADDFFRSRWDESGTATNVNPQTWVFPEGLQSPVEKPEAKKNDRFIISGKPPMDLLPPAALAEVAKVLAYGAAKYGRHNWRAGFEWSRLIAAALRHVNAFNDGEDNDPDTDLSHMAHAACMVLFLLEHQIRRLGTDDRYKEARC